MNAIAQTTSNVIDATKNHKVWVAIALLITALAVVNQNQAIESVNFAVDALVETAPFLLLSILLTAYAAASKADGLIASVFRGAPVAMIFLAAIFGAFSPFCSCGVIPLIAALLAMGVPISAVMAFWLASPLMDPSMFLLTIGVLGIEFTIAKTIATIGIGMLGGFTMLALESKLENPLRPNVSAGGCGTPNVQNPDPIIWKFWAQKSQTKVFVREALSVTEFLAKWLGLAFLLESLMIAWVPAETVTSVLGGSGVVTIVTATFIGVPAYLNGYAALPLVSGLIDQGMAPGAGIAFLIAGGVTSLPAAIAVWALVKPKIFVLYIVLSLVGAFTAGLAYQIFVSM